jgi:N4-gp56 family major capsid protein
VNVNKYGDISPRTAALATKRLLDRGQVGMNIERFGYFDPQPRNASDTRKWRRYLTLPRAVAPLAECITPPGKNLAFRDYSATLEEWGDIINISGKVADLHEDPVLTEAMDLAGEQASESIEYARWVQLCAGTVVYYTGSATQRSEVVAAPSIKNVRQIVRNFDRFRAKKLTKIVNGTTRVGTTPIEASFICLCHTDLKGDLRNMTGFQTVDKYGDSMNALPNEVGNAEDVRFLCSSLYDPYLASGATTSAMISNGTLGSASAADVYPMIFFGANAYGITPLAGKRAVEIGVINPGTKTKSDPLGRFGFVSWKTWQAFAILNDLWVARLEAAATYAP